METTYHYRNGKKVEREEIKEPECIRIFYCDKCYFCRDVTGGVGVPKCEPCNNSLRWINIERDLLRNFYGLLGDKDE